LIEPGTKEICRAIINSWHQSVLKRRYVTSRVEAKLDSCGSVSIGHFTLLSNIKTCKEYRIPSVTLKGIGGRTEPYCVVVLTYLWWSWAPGWGAAWRPMSSRTTFRISSTSWAPFCHGLSETKGKHRLLVLRVLCCSTVREAFPMKSVGGCAV
jgi:hypothetical protein